VQRQENEQFVMETYFKKGKRRFSRIVSQFCEDPTAVLESAESIFKGMLPDMAYISKTDHPVSLHYLGSDIKACIYAGLSRAKISF
jgi:hypothetical protein